MPRSAPSWAVPVALAAAGLLAWGLAVIVAAKWHQSGLAETFVGGGVVLVVLSAFYGRMYGRTTVGSLDTNIAPTADVAVRGRAEQPMTTPAESDPAVLQARWPTLDAALQSVPVGWKKDKVRHPDGQDFIHVKSPLGAFDVAISVAACDSPAPRWLLVAINAMTNEG